MATAFSHRTIAFALAGLETLNCPHSSVSVNLTGNVLQDCDGPVPLSREFPVSCLIYTLGLAPALQPRTGIRVKVYKSVLKTTLWFMTHLLVHQVVYEPVCFCAGTGHIVRPIAGRKLAARKIC